MSRKRRNRSEQRDNSFPIANFVAVRHPTSFSRPSPVTFSRPRVALSEIEDRRTYHPLGFFRPARSFNRSQHTLVVKQPPKNRDRFSGLRGLPTAIQFHAPKKVLVCVRRQRRKEVIHALKKIGKGAAKRFRRRSYYSNIHC